ncbi:MAG: hypothetical protein LBJ10_11440 [Clostridiales bacterium]|nr:hypothetical protein [Clostridiales bacterium]
MRFVKRPVHFFQHGAKELVFVDYASCGGGLNAGHPFRVWFGEPMLASEIFSTGVRAIISGEGIKMPDA